MELISAVNQHVAQLLTLCIYAVRKVVSPRQANIGASFSSSILPSRLTTGYVMAAIWQRKLYKSGI